MKQRKRWKVRGKAPTKPLQLEELEAIVDYSKAFLSEEHHAMLKAAVDNLQLLTEELQAEGASMERLRRRWFGRSGAGTQPGPAGTSEDEEAGEDLPGRPR